MDLKKSVSARFRTANRRRESFEAKWEHFFYAAFGIGFRVFPRFDNPQKMSDNRRQWADFLAALATLLHRQYKTARTETRWHLPLKIRQMPIQTSASRGYVLFKSADKRCTKVLKLSADCGHSPRVFKAWKDTDHRRYQAQYIRNTPFYVLDSRRRLAVRDRHVQAVCKNFCLPHSMPRSFKLLS